MSRTPFSNVNNIHVHSMIPMSVSWYPYSRSQIVKFVLYTKWIPIAKRIANCFVNNDFGQTINTKRTKTNQHRKHCQSRKWPGDLSHLVCSIPFGPPRQLNVSIKVNLFNCFYVIGQTINKQSQGRFIRKF